MPVELISVHLPRTAGGALRRSLNQVFEPSELKFDYRDRPLNPDGPMHKEPERFFARANAPEREQELEGIRVIHGHFNIRKYARLQSALAITFLRDPIRRHLSHYFWWRQTRRHNHPIHNQMLDNDLTPVEAARLPMLKNIMAGVFFAGVDMARFDLIGHHERYEEDLQRLSGRLGRPLKSIPGINKSANPDDKTNIARILDDPKMMAALRDALRDDIEFYEKHAR